MAATLLFIHIDNTQKMSRILHSKISLQADRGNYSHICNKKLFKNIYTCKNLHTAPLSIAC